MWGDKRNPNTVPGMKIYSIFYKKFSFYKKPMTGKVFQTPKKLQDNEHPAVSFNYWALWVQDRTRSPLKAPSYAA